MHPANDNTPLAADRVMEIRPSPQELNRLLHRRFHVMGEEPAPQQPARQADAVDGVALCQR